MTFNRYTNSGLCLIVIVIHLFIALLHNYKDESTHTLSALSLICGIALVITTTIICYFLIDFGTTDISSLTAEQLVTIKNELYNNIRITMGVHLIIFSSIYFFRFYELSRIYTIQIVISHCELLFLISTIIYEYYKLLPKQNSNFAPLAVEIQSDTSTNIPHNANIA
jgi:hypothetical protein